MSREGGREGGRREGGTLSSRWVGWRVAEGPRRRRTRALVKVLISSSVEEEGGRDEGREDEEGREETRL